ncbi:MAG: RagB/SusD family nutrient uptake outer membrane protein [Prevotellaceae bacterium]|jgi:hypothetical protein|nr:RagB/SusD family nutrient uptake outer membrane protein [Prevotellaceae bacterium]
MKTVRKILVFTGLILYVTSCADYLNIVPDNTRKIEDIFTMKSEAYNALAKVYSYLPHDDDVNVSTFTLGDEWVGRLDWNNEAERLRPMRIMRDLQSTVSAGTQLGLWSGTGGVKSLYQAIRQCNIFLQNINLVHDMTDQEKNEWAAQVKFLKAYYHFLLVRQYGPVVIVDELLNPDEMSEELLFPKRSKIDECFDYIINLMNESITGLNERAAQVDLGQIDQVAAKAIKARVLLFRASPFFNGNRDIFGDFYDFDGEPYFPQTYDKEKWKDVIDAVDDAITSAKRNGVEMYKFNKVFYGFDSVAVNRHPDRMQTLYDLRLLVTDPWNNELIWANSNLIYLNTGAPRHEELAFASNIRLPNNQIYSGNGNSEKNSNFASGQWLGASYQMTERYYTKNGLPIDEDLTFNMADRYNIVTTPGSNDPAYEEMRGLMQPGVETVNLYLNRELRFYANLGISGGYFRAHRYGVMAMMYQEAEGGRTSTFPDEYLYTGVGVQKFVHPESGSGWYFWQVHFPYPIIRLADLYLMKAEALNEYNEGPNPDVYAAINEVRRRAGIEDVEKVWSNPSLARTVNKHTDYLGMRDIILQERSIELAFEGSRYWDMVRYKRAVSEFSSPILGWNVLGTTARTFFVLESKQARKFPVKNYLWPIDLDELNTNANLKQNPGW